MPIKSIGYALLVAWWLMASASFADPLPPRADRLHVEPNLSFSALLGQAMQRYPRRTSVKSLQNEAEAWRRQAESWLAEPGGLGLHWQDDRLLGNDGLREWEASWEMPLRWRGQRGARRALATQMDKLAAARREALHLELAGRIREALWKVVVQDNLAELSAAEFESADNLRQDIARRVEVGELARSDLLLAKQSALEKKAAQSDADIELQLAWQGYQMLTGTDRVPVDFREQQSEREAILPTHPEAAKLLVELELTRLQVERVRADARGTPALAFTARRERGMAGDDYQDSVGVGISLPLGGKAGAAPELAETQSEFDRIQAGIEQLFLDLELRLHEAARRLHNEQQALTLAEEQQELAQQHLKLAEKAFALGESDLIKLLNARNVFFTAQRAKRQRRIAVQHAIALYNQAVGVLP